MAAAGRRAREQPRPADGAVSTEEGTTRLTGAAAQAQTAVAALDVPAAQPAATRGGPLVLDALTEAGSAGRTVLSTAAREAMQDVTTTVAQQSHAVRAAEAEHVGAVRGAAVEASRVSVGVRGPRVN